MIDRKEIEKLMKEYAEEKELKSFSLNFHQGAENLEPFFSVYENGAFITFDELESEKDNAKYRFTVKIVDDENLEEESVYFIDTTYELLTDAMDAFENFDVSKIWFNGYFRDKETYKTKSVEKSVLRIGGEHPFKLIVFEAYGVREHEAELH